MAHETSGLRSFFRGLSIVLLGSVVAALAIVTGTVWYLAQGLPDVKTLKTYQHSHATEVFSDDGQKIGEFTTERRYPVRYEDIPKHVIHGFLAAEDSKFFEHHGIDYNGIARAIFSNLLRGRYAQGGSTVTQQVARALLLETKKKEITRKIREIILSMRMERELSKKEILSLYLSEIYLGHGAYGIGAAARNYFGKKVQDLDIAEGAILAGLPQRPNEWNPFHNPAQSKRRQAYVIKRMVEDGFITEKEGSQAYNESVRLKSLEDINESKAPFFVEYVRQHLMKKYGSANVLSQGYKVVTTVRYDFQKTAEKAMERGLREVDKRLGWRGVIQHLDTAAQIEAFKKNVHEEIITELNPMRLLPANAASGAKSLEYDLSTYLDKRSAYVGSSPVREGGIYKAVVTSVKNDRKSADVEIGGTNATLSAQDMDWVKVEGKPWKELSQILHSGDAIFVKVVSIDKRQDTAVVSLEQEPEVQGGLLSYEIQNGFVRAMVGGRDFRKNKFNVALQAKRQVGSTFKPLIYAAAIDKGFSPSSIVTDSPIVFKFDGKADADSEVPAQEESWKPHNYGNKFEGDIPLRRALIRSMNIPTVKLLNEITIDYGIQYARTLGITATLPRDLTIGLGSWSTSLEEIMRAYAIFPRLGKPVVLNYIKRIEDSNGNVVEEFTENLPTTAKVEPTPSQKPKEGEAPGLGNQLVISPQTAYVMTDMLKAVVHEDGGTGRAAANVPGSVAGKTGTSNDHRDAWFIGYSPNVMAGIWIGYEKDKPLDAAETGGKAAAPIWSEYMRTIASKYPVSDFPIPDDIVFAYIDKNTGKLAGPTNPNRIRVAFRQGTVPNAAGDNIRRVGEPGVRARSTATGDSVVQPNQEEAVGSPTNEETSDFLRNGYQD